MWRLLAVTAAATASKPLGSTRLLATAAAQQAAGVELEDQLQLAPWMFLLKVPGMGRGLFATADIEQGTVVHEEAPMLATPSPHALDTTCHACLRPLHARHGLGVASSSSEGTSTAEVKLGLEYCSAACKSSAEQTWAAAAADCDFRALQRACREGGEKFPLLAAQLACMQVQQQSQQQAQPHQQQQGRHECGGSSGSVGDGHATARRAEADEVLLRGDALTQLRHLCYANVGEPPEPWVQLHSLLLAGLAPLASNPRRGACTPEGLRQQFSLAWFCNVMSRLHLNCFRVDTVPPLDLSDPSALLRAAAASVSESAGLSGALGSSSSSSSQAGASAEHHTGTAAYLLASMFNHSCEPNLHISWPCNNAAARFTAARHIAAHEQLTISYIDAEQGVEQRRAALRFAYGFECACPRCRDGL